MGGEGSGGRDLSSAQVAAACGWGVCGWAAAAWVRPSAGVDGGAGACRRGPTRAVSLRGAAPRKSPQGFFQRHRAERGFLCELLKKIIRLKVENAKNNRYNIGVKS